MADVGHSGAESGNPIAKQVMPIVFAIFIVMFLDDAAHNKLGSSNGKFISFVDTCSSVCQYRAGLSACKGRGLGNTRIVWIMTACLIIKFLAGSIVSLILGKSPVWLSGPRHVLSLVIGLVLLWLAPGDMIYKNMRHSSAIRLLVGMGDGLYKMRKAIFAVEAVAQSCQNVQECSLAFAFLVTVLAVDGNSLTRRIVLWMERRLEGGMAPSIAEDVESLLRDGCDGVQRLLNSTLIPLGVVSALLWHAACSEWPNGATSDSFLVLRVGLLGVFIWRAGSFHELADIHAASLRISPISEQLCQEASAKSNKTE